MTSLSFKASMGLAESSLVVQVTAECYPCTRTALIPMYAGYAPGGSDRYSLGSPLKAPGSVGERTTP
jgi:hypothetical protein